MCKTERLRFLGDEEKKTPHLTWDEGHAWTLCMALRSDKVEESEKWKLAGELRRGEEVLTLNDVRVIVPGGLVIHATSSAAWMTSEHSTGSACCGRTEHRRLDQ